MSQTVSHTEKLSSSCSHWIFFHSDKTKAELLGSHFKKWNLLEQGVLVSFYRKRQSDVAMDSDLVYCEEIQELMEELQLGHNFQGVEAFHWFL